MITLVRAAADDSQRLLPMIRDYHAMAGIESTDMHIDTAIAPLLRQDATGRIFLIENDVEVVGYLALCFGHSIEFGGRDAFVDELFIVPAWRNRGYGRAAMAALLTQLGELDIRALHLEVAQDNTAARRIYSALGFEPRANYQLMTRR
jgi:ribosomal protein S18 acetylase RimI-like enzyme